MKKKPYKFIWGNSQYLVTVQMNLISPLKYPEIPWNNINRILEISRNNKISTYHGAEDLERDVEEGKNYLNKDFGQKFISSIDKAVNRHKGVFAELQDLRHDDLSAEEFFLHAKKAIDSWSELISYFRGHQDEASYKLIDEIKKYVSDENLSDLLLPTELDPLNYEQIDWQEILKNDFDEEVLWNHVKKYPWLAANHFSYKQIEQTLTDRFNFDKEHRTEVDIRKQKELLKEKQNKILKDLPENVKYLISFAHKLAVTRMVLKAYWSGTDFYLIPIFEGLGKKAGETGENICRHYLIDEIEELSKGKKLSEEEKEKRKYFFIGLLKDKKAVYKSGKEAEELAKKELGDLFEVTNTKEIKGTSANKGKITGTVRILHANNAEQAMQFRKNFKKGEILVTEMTQPAIVDIAQKAGAIITDEGGMLSHAAIISREFKIPCVVGTYKATQVLKDGDTVEVDADKGIVRIL